MTLRWPTVLFTLILSIAAGLAGAEIGIRRTLAVYPGPISGGVQWALKKAINSDLELSSEQRSQLNDIEQRHAAARQKVLQELRARTNDFINAVTKDPDMGSEVVAAQNRMHDASHASEAEAFAHAQDVRRVLTPAQRAVLDGKLQTAMRSIAQAL